MRLKHRERRRFLVGIVMASLALGVAACGGDDEDEGAQGNDTEQALLQGKVPHHQSAIDMARVAQERGEQKEVRDLADDIVAAQSKEIRQIRAIHQRLFDSEVKPDTAAHERLGLSAKEAAAEHTDVGELRTAKPLDREFIDMMVPHHQGAIRMARVVLGKTDDAEVERLANAIIQAQSREIGQMNDWRTDWYGSPSPAGGVPPANEKSSEPAEH
jgi:uncharacterized protein (DUF305 family)